jgi:hypothetical protein
VIYFNKFLWKVMARAYTHKLSTIRDEAGLKDMCNKSTVLMTGDGGNMANKQSDSVSTMQASCKEEEPRSESQPIYSQEPFHKVASWDNHDTWPNWEGDRYNGVGSSWTSLLTPCSSAQEPAKEIVEKGFTKTVTTQKSRRQSQVEPDYGICPYWQQHCTAKNLWKSCERCKSYN